MSEFPNSWTWHVTPGVGVAGSFSIPAIPGVSHVITSILAEILNSGAGAAGNVDVGVTIDGIYVAQFNVDFPPGGGQSSGSASLQGPIVAPAGSSMGVAYLAVNGTVRESLHITGYAL